ncbi:MAG: right-handed parallel beta-helix repeat-containing protein [Planctomycetes bacterium]|nr:right-handed parallel beta-helix repeat-containing protein [Planctomycetota bacterium]
MTLRSIAFVLLLASCAMAQVLRVPSQYPSIGAALAAAASGTTILVAPGTYSERLSWPPVDGVRLIAEQGAATTVLDGAFGGTVVEFTWAGLTPATVLQGFTITNGLLAAPASAGAGVAVRSGAPTIAHNRITGNRCVGSGTNRGAGLAILGADSHPKVFYNEIDGNELRDGTRAEGAGICVADAGSTTFLLGNRIHDNRIGSTSAAPHTGRGAGIYFAGVACAASGNMITRNRCTANVTNFGGGVMVDSGSNVRLSNNTIADNAVAGTQRRGGGVYIDGTCIVQLWGSIIATNSDEGIARGPTSPAYVALNANDVWGNPGGDYVNLPPGIGDISADPQFVGGSDYHLLPGSPCIDNHAWAAPSAWTDVDGDSRLLDASLGTGPTPIRYDIGADEAAATRLTRIGSPRIGTTFSWVVSSSQPATFALAFAFERANQPLGSFGVVLIEQAQAVIAAFGTTPGGAGVSLPNAPTLRGVRLFAQGLTLFGPTVGQLTNLDEITVY